MQQLRFGVLGAAKIATEKVIPAMQQGERTRVVALASRSGDRAAVTAADLGIDRVHVGYDDLLADDDVDAVYIPLPNHLHTEWTIAAARAGKHVLCEKPMAMDAPSAERMLEACRDAGVVFMEAFMYRLHPQWSRTRALVQSGAIGEPLAVHTHFSYSNEDPHDIRNIAAYGGGALMDIGCYCIDVPRLLFGADPEAVTGAVEVDQRFGTDVLASATMRFPDGRHGTFTCGTQCAPHQRVLVVGAQGRIEVDVPFNAPNDDTTRLWVTRDGVTAEEVVEPVDQYTLQGDAFAGAVLDGAPVPVPHGTGPAVLRVIEQLRDQ